MASRGGGKLVVALYDYEGGEEGDLIFRKGDRIRVTAEDGAWWTGELNGKSGIFPSTYVKLVERVKSVADVQQVKQDATVLADDEAAIPPPRCPRVMAYMFMEGPKAALVAVWLTGNLVYFFFTYYSVMLAGDSLVEGTSDPTKNAYRADPRGLGLGMSVSFAKSFAALLKVNCSLILVPVLRNFLGWVRALPFSAYLPLDKNIVFHKKMAIVVALAAVGHTVCHLWNVMKLTNIRITRMKEYTPLARMRKEDAESLWWWAYGSIPGGTGFALLIVMLLMWCGTWKKLRNSNFENFWYSHHLFIAFYALLIPHGFTQFFGKTEMWKFCCGPLTLYGVERLIRLTRGWRSTMLHCVRKHPSNVIELQIKIKGMKYKAGQYVFINVPKISNWEWHPFTISSAPEETYLTCHIKQVGDFTKCLSTLFNPKGIDTVVYDVEKASDGTRLIRVDGPFGAPSEDFSKFNAVMLIGAGIGVTPFASILKSVGYNIQRPPDESKLKKIYFYWVMREHAGFEWFADVLSELEAVNHHGVLEIGNYMTGSLKPDEIKSIMYADSGSDPLTGLKTPTHYGRPAWGNIFKQMAEKHSGSEIGVFFCGPRVLSKELYAQSKAHQDPIKRTIFKYHKENF